MINTKTRRYNIGEMEGRNRFRGTVDGFGHKPGFRNHGPKPTIIIVDIINVATGEQVTDHLWFNLTAGFQDASLSVGDVVEFDARSKQYEKGYVNWRRGIDDRTIDYKLSHPTRIERISELLTTRTP